MANYHPRKFFRNVPNKLLQRYFSQKVVLAELEWDKISETGVEPIYQAWLALDPAQRDNLEQDFREIDLLASEGGTKAILDEAAFHEEDLAETFSKMKSHHERAFWCGLARPHTLAGVNPAQVAASHGPGIKPCSGSGDISSDA